MKTLRRYDIPNAYYFISCVTFERQPILTTNSKHLIQCWREYDPVAYVVIPDHFHLIVKPEEKTVSEIMHSIKIRFARYVRDNVRPGRVWQNRFYDHIIRDETDFNRHIDYIHYNPVKHGLAESPAEYDLSSFRQYLRAGLYPPDWGEALDFGSGSQFGE